MNNFPSLENSTIEANDNADYKNVLLSLVDSGILNETAVENMISEMTKNKIKNAVIAKLGHEPKIYYHNDGKRIFTKIKLDGTWKQILGYDIDDLYKKLYEFYHSDFDITLTDLFPKFMLNRRDKKKVCSKTMQENKRDWDRYLKDSEIAKIPMRKLKPRDYITLFENITMNRTLTYKSVSNIRSLLNKMYAFAIEKEYVEYNPVLSVDFSEFKYYVPDNSDKAYSIENRQKLLSYLYNIVEPYSLAIQLDFQLTCRIGEIKALRWENVDFDNRTITIKEQALNQREMKDDLTFDKTIIEVVPRVKGDTPQGKRIIPMTTEAMRILQLAKEINPTGEFVFMPYGRIMLTDTFNDYLKKYCNKAGVPYYSSHKIRFTSCSTLYNGDNLAEVSRLMGHSQVQTTLHYLRNVHDTSEMLSQMENAFAVAAPNCTK